MTVHHGADILYSLASMGSGQTTGTVRATVFQPDQATQTKMLNGLSGCKLYNPQSCLNASVYGSNGAVQSTYYAYTVTTQGSGPPTEFQYAILDTTDPSYTAVLVGYPHTI